MKVVIQRVSSATMSCGNVRTDIDKGLVVYFGVEEGDTDDKISKIATKIVNMRIFEDENGKMNLSVLDIAGQILAISQFTLLADCSCGNRPSFTKPMKPQVARQFYDTFLDELRKHKLTVHQGVFGGDMTITQTNIGPCTIIYEI